MTVSIFKESKGYRPFAYPWAVEAAKKQNIDLYWDVHQLDLTDDLRQYNSVDGLKTPNVSHEVNKYILDMSLMIFTESDSTVKGGYAALLPYVKNNEAKTWFTTAAAKEVVHERAYAIAAETFGFSDSQWTDFQEFHEMRDKLSIMTVEEEDLSNHLNFAKELGRIFLSEGIGLFAPFTSLLNMKRHGLVIGFNDVNQWSLVDEQEHVVNNIRFWKDIRKTLRSEDKEILDRFVIELSGKIVDAEHKYIDLVYQKGDQEDLTKEDLKKYIEYLMDFRLHQCGLLAEMDIRENPLEWMEWLVAGGRHDNFFEKKVTDYSHEKLSGEVDYEVFRDTS